MINRFMGIKNVLTRNSQNDELQSFKVIKICFQKTTYEQTDSKLIIDTSLASHPTLLSSCAFVFRRFSAEDSQWKIAKIRLIHRTLL